jgi:hypothetical protein
MILFIGHFGKGKTREKVNISNTGKGLGKEKD